MATSGTWNFNLEILDVITEAFERCGLDPAGLTARHLNSARRSLNLLLGEWEAQGYYSAKLDEQSVTLTQGDIAFSLPAGTLDVVDAILRRDGIDVPMFRTTRSDWMMLPTKEERGRPNQFWIDRSEIPNTDGWGGVGSGQVTTNPAMIYWPASDSDDDVLIYYRLTRHEDAVAFTDNPDVARFWLEALCAGLATKLAVKFAPDRVPVLTPLGVNAFNVVLPMTRPRGDVILRPRWGSRRGRR